MDQLAALRQPYEAETLGYFKGILLEERVRVLARLQRNSYPIFIEELQSTERTDRPQISTRYNNSERKDRGDLADVDQALERIEDGSYGLCVNCGERILLERLKAIPTARSCVLCQAKKPQDNLRVLKRR